MSQDTAPPRLTAWIEYRWEDGGATCAHRYLMPVVLSEIARIANGKPLRILDLGCGNGFVTNALALHGHQVLGVDWSEEGITRARVAGGTAEFRVASIYDDRLPELVGEGFDCVIALEVIEHLVLPRELFRQAFRLLGPRGCLIVSTPYHGYLKNLAISLLNGWDRHFSVDWDGGHIKFFSRRTLIQMARQTGFQAELFAGLGRLPFLWRSMVVTFRRAVASEASAGTG